MRKQLVFLSLILMVFFLNACVAIPIIAGGVTLTCVAYEEAAESGHAGQTSEERCWALEEIDERIKEGWIKK